MFLSFSLLRPLFLVATNSLLPDDENNLLVVAAEEEDVVEDEVDAIADDTLLVNIFFVFVAERHEARAFIKDKTCEERERERKRERLLFWGKFGSKRRDVAQRTRAHKRDLSLFCLFSSPIFYFRVSDSILQKKKERSQKKNNNNNKKYIKKENE